jgi:hypothetical protein
MIIIIDVIKEKTTKDVCRLRPCEPCEGEIINNRRQNVYSCLK